MRVHAVHFGEQESGGTVDFITPTSPNPPTAEKNGFQILSAFSETMALCKPGWK